MGRESKDRKNLLIGIFGEIFRYRELLVNLATRGIKAQYKQTFFGIVWAIFPPLSTMLVFAFINRMKIINIDTGGIPYPIFAYCGLLPWTFFASSLTGATASLAGHAGIMHKIYFPRVIIPLSTILSKLINLGIASLILVGLMLFYGVKPHLTIIAVPLLLLIQIAFIAGLVFFFSAGHVFYRDVGYIVAAITPLWMFVTSVVYPIKVASPQLQAILTTLNPMIPIIDAYRDVILEGKWPDITALIVPICLCFSLFIIGLIWFHKVEHLFIENV